MRVVFSLALVFLTFNPTGHSYYHWLQANLSPVQPPVVIAGICCSVLGWSSSARLSRSMGMVGVVLLLALFARHRLVDGVLRLAVAGRPARRWPGWCSPASGDPRPRHVVVAPARADLGPGRSTASTSERAPRRNATMSDQPTTATTPAQPRRPDRAGPADAAARRLAPDLRKYFRPLRREDRLRAERAGAYSFDRQKLRAFIALLQRPDARATRR